MGSNKGSTISAERLEYINTRIEDLKPWYHKIDLGNGVVTPGRDYDHMWDATRRVMDCIDYKDKNVLDLASWDGLWAFTAEQKGASLVVSSDIRLEGYRNLLFAREVLQSDVIPLCNVAVQDLKNRLNIVGMPEKFDIIHHFGLLYHLRDPMVSLAQVRNMLSDNGILVLETAFIDDDSKSYMAYSGLEGNHHFYGISDTWAPTRLCLKEMLVRSFLKPVMEEKWQVAKNRNNQKNIRNLFGKKHPGPVVNRITVIAELMDPEEGHAVDRRKVFGPQ